MYAHLLRRLSSRHAVRRTKRQLAFEALEGRQLMSIGPLFVVDTPENTYKDALVTASSTTGCSVAVWVEYALTNNGQGLGVSDLQAQYFNSGVNKTGPEIYVAIKVGVSEDQPAVAMDSQGNFVVAWREHEPNGNTDVLAQKFNSSSEPITPVIPVGAGTFYQHEPSVAMAANGNFVVTYTRDTNDNNPDVFAKAYYANGQLRTVITVAASANAESNPSIAMDSAGAFDVAYQVQNGATTQVFVARYSAAESLLGVVSVPRGSASDSLPQIAMDNVGDAAVAYCQSTDVEAYEIDAMRISAAGVASAPFNVGEWALMDDNTGIRPSVAYQASGGFFAVAYTQDVENDSPVSVEVNVVNPSNSITQTYNLSGYWVPSISTLQSFGFVVAYVGFGNGSTLTNDIYGAVGFYY
jgi:hypothetical protein